MMTEGGKYCIRVSGSLPYYAPVEILDASLRVNDEVALYPLYSYFMTKEWGEPSSDVLPEGDTPVPTHLDITWLSLAEKKIYSAAFPLPQDKLDLLFKQQDEKRSRPLYEHIVVGMAPYGGVAVWVYGYKSSVLIDWQQATEITVNLADYLPVDPEASIDVYCDYYLNEDEAAMEYLNTNGLPSRHLFDKYMHQFCYRYLPMFQQWDEESEQWKQLETDDEAPHPELDYIQEELYDGTHDKLHNDRLMNYHEAGKPKKLAMQWHMGKKEFTAYVWMEDEGICAVFDRFYGNHRDTKVDFIIRIDPNKKKYQLALYHYGLEEPVTISEDAYQMIVFKDQFEHYRTKNYDQPRGAWIW